MKKKTVASVTVLFLLTAVCAIVHYTVNPTIVREVCDDAAPKIAESWLQKQISLRDYEVTEAHFFTFEDPQTKYAAKYVAMTYSVRPYPYSSACWYAGNGEDGGDGWLVEKHGFISYRRVGPFVVTGTACNTGP